MNVQNALHELALICKKISK